MSAGEERNDTNRAVDIPSSQQSPPLLRRRGTGISFAASVSNFGNTLQSWTANYSHTASTYMSDNISVPASFVSEHLPTEDYDYPSTSQVHDTQYLSPPISIPRSFYGSYLPPISGSPSDSVDARSIAYSERRPRHSRVGSYASSHRFHDETLPLNRTFTKSSISTIPVSVVQDVGDNIPIGSTFRQSIFNSCNILIGIGILALPLGFRYAGWITGLSLFMFCLGVTNYTAKVLAKCLDSDEGLHTYADMGAIAYGEGARLAISCLFSLELIASSTALVILVGDSLYTLFPSISVVALKIIAWLIMTPLTLIAIRYLSYFSLMGILSAVVLVSVLLYDGGTKLENPGSLIDPMPTELFPLSLYALPMSFGLIMAGFTGHAVFPTVYRDMENPKEYPKMVDLTYFMTAIVYLGMACGGYLMFGNSTLQEITQNIMATPGYNIVLNKFLVWMVALNPIAKYALTLNPINLTLEIYYNSLPAVEDWCNRGRGRRTTLMFVSRAVVSAVVLVIAIRFPGFDRVMGILGSFFSFTTSAIFPCMCHLRLFSRELSWNEWLLNWFIILSCTCLAVLGTIWAFLPMDE